MAKSADVKIVVSGAVDAHKPGVYALTYRAVDAAGNAAIEMVGTVEVVASGVNIAIRIEQIVPEPFGFSFESQKGKDYVVEFSEDLRTGESSRLTTGQEP